MLPISEYGAAYAVLQQAALQVIGVDFYTCSEHTERSLLPQWRSYTRGDRTSWHCTTQADYWSQLAHGALRQGRGPLWDVASRISNQIRVCEWRLRQLSDAYHDQLVAVIRSRRFKPDTGISDGFTWLGYLAFQSFLIDACALRDYLAEYRALVLPVEVQPKPRVTSLAKLRDSFLTKQTLETDIDRDLESASAPGGWIYTLTQYRNLVVHYAPLAIAKHELYAYCELTKLTNGGVLPTIKLPIPANPAEIIAMRRSGDYLDDPSQDYARFGNVFRHPGAAADGLAYALTTVSHLGATCSGLATLSPVKARPRQFIVDERGELQEPE